MEEVTLVLAKDEVSGILGMLVKCPMEQVEGLVAKIRKQIAQE